MICDILPRWVWEPLGCTLGLAYNGAQDVVNNIALTVKKYEDRPGYSVSLHISREDEDKTGD